MQKVVVITGPTCSGKTKLGVDISLKIDGEVVNADSQQVYRGMDVGTAKPVISEMRDVPHHLYSVINPDEEWNAARYAGEAEKVVADILSRGKVPVLVGGSQLYIRALLRGMCEIPLVSSQAREIIGQLFANEGVEGAWSRLAEADPSAAERISHGDSQRIRRALEVHESTGKPISEYQRSHGFSEKKYEWLKIALKVPRAELHSRINDRAVRLFKEGFLEETKRLLEQGYDPALRSFKAHGYRYAADAVRGLMTVEKAIELTARDTRRYAKRQETWLRSEPDVQWIARDDLPGALILVKKFLSGTNSSSCQ